MARSLANPHYPYTACKRCGEPIVLAEVELIFDSDTPKGRKPKGKDRKWDVFEPSGRFHACRGERS